MKVAGNFHINMAKLNVSFKKLIAVFLVIYSVSCTKTKPNIIVIIADDMGWNDVGFHGSDQIPTPNIDALAYNGIILNQHYTQALCTPSRTAFLTGKYPYHLGMQHLVLLASEPRGLPLTEKLLSEHLREAGYTTHAVGKWHLGFYRHEYLPLYRGFDTHYGYWNGLQDYYNHMVKATYSNMTGYDMRRNMEVDWEARGKYSTTLFTNEAVKLIKEHDTNKPMFMYLAHLAPHSGNKWNPLQAPDDEIAKFAHIPDPERRIYAAMVSMLDKSVGDVVTALREKHMLENSIILFISDNGAQTNGIHANHGSNYPLKGLKLTPFEGGSRGVATVWSPLLKKRQRVSDQLMHISDWLPTFFSAAGIDHSKLGQIDGIDMWDTLSQDLKSPRNEMVYNIDDTFNYAAIRRGDWKYVIGTVVEGKLDGWQGDSGVGPLYHYDESLVLNSKAANALVGVTTELQIRERQGNSNVFNFTSTILTKEQLLELRNKATVRCPKVNADETSHAKCNPLESPCLFNLHEDPCETINMASERPMILKSLENSLVQYRKTLVKEANVPEDPNGDPARWNNTWVTWQDCDFVKTQKINKPLSDPAIAVLAVVCILFLVIGMILISISVKTSSLQKQQTNNTKLLATHDDLDLPTDVIHVTTNDKDAKNDNFQNATQSRQDAARNLTRNIN